MRSEFPALIPSAAPITPGTWASSSIQALSGGRTVTRSSSAEVGRRLQLTFLNITEEHFLWLRNHYRGHRSRFDLFTFNAATVPAAQSPSGQLWRWAGPPRVTDDHADVFTVVCEFIAQPRLLVQMGGAAWRTGETTLTRGAFTGVTEAFGTGAAWVTSSTTLTPGAASIVAQDPNFSAVSLLLHMDGANNSTTFTDSSSNALAVTRNGNAKISTTQSKYGGAAGYLDGDGDYLQLGYNSVLDLIGGDFTIEAFIYPTSFKGSGMRIAAAGGGAVGWNGSNGIHWLFQLDGNGYPQLQWWTGSTTGSAAGTTAVSLNTWSHVAVVISGGTLYLAANGTVNSASVGSIARPSTNPVFTIGTINGEAGGPSTAFDGYVDEFRVTKGVARYNANFTPPAAAFPDA